MPITKMMNIERRHGEDKPVIKKALVELDGKPFKYFEAHRDEWAVETSYTFPGAIQYYGPTEVCDLTTRTLAVSYTHLTENIIIRPTVIFISTEIWIWQKNWSGLMKTICLSMII